MTAPLQVAADTPISITLQLQQWRALCEVLAEGPFRVVSPLMGAIDRQCAEQLQQKPIGAVPRGNGAAHAEEALDGD